MPKTHYINDFLNGLTGNYNGIYWYVMDSIGGMFNPIGKMPKTHNKNEFCNGFTGNYNGVYWYVMILFVGC